MADPRQIESDLREYLEKSDNLRNADKYQYLKAIFDKHFATQKLDHMITKHDLHGIVSGAKAQFTNLRVRPNVSGKEVEQGDLVALSVIEAFTGYLNRNHLLQKSVKVDYTDEDTDAGSLEDL